MLVKRLTFVFIFVVLLSGFVSSAEVAPDVYSELEGEERVRIVVSVEQAEAWWEEYGFFGKFFGWLGSMMRLTGFSVADGVVELGIQEELVAEVGEEKLRYRFDDALLLEISAEDLAFLEEHEDVAAVELEGVREIFLQDSVGLVQGDFDLSVGGLALTGAGQTVCVLDTGVDYVHPDLGGCYGNNTDGTECKIVGGHDFVNGDEDPDDDHGHGTHVAGIVAASGNITGVAPGATVLAVKVCNSGGSCSDGDIRAGIDWCVQNTTGWNVSVISMSIGGGSSVGHCNDDFLAGSIDAAVAENVSVVIASGNSGSSSAISAPACVEGAIPVGSTDKDGGVSSFSNRNALIQVFAPGRSINSTLGASGYGVLSGTSMSTPHVSGAIAVLGQYLTAVGDVLSPSELEGVLNATGGLVDDSSGSGLNYSGIDVFAALLSLDGVEPTVALVSPDDGHVGFLGNVSFTCSATDLALSSSEMNVWNSSGEEVFVGEWNVSGSSGELGGNVSDLGFGSYSWGCSFADAAGNVGVGENRSFTVADAVSVSLTGPADGLVTNRNESLTCEGLGGRNLSSITMLVWNASGDIVADLGENVSVGGLNKSVNMSFDSEGGHSWNCEAVSGNVSAWASTNRTVTYDVTAPGLMLVRPVDGALVNSGLLNVSLDEAGSCSYDLVGSGNGTFVNFTTVENVSDGDYEVLYSCADEAGNGVVGGANFTIESAAPVVKLVSPADGHSVTGAQSVTFSFNVTEDLAVGSCGLVYNSAEQAAVDDVAVNVTQSVGKNMGVEDYYWSISCEDSAGNVGVSESRSLTVNGAASSGGSSSGGSSSGDSGDSGSSSSSGASSSSSTSGGQLSTPSRVQTDGGYRKQLAALDQVKFVVGASGEEHSVTVEKVNAGFVQLVVQSDPVTVVLREEEFALLNLTSAERYDVRVELLAIVGSRADLRVQTVDEEIPVVAEEEIDLSPEVESEGERSVLTGEVVSEDLGETRGWVVWVVWVVVGVLVLGAVVFWWKRRSDGQKAV
jgi:subtilisin family serine protease